MSDYQLAQLNIATMKFPADSPELADFMDNLDRINALAEATPGFVWRLQTEEGDATEIRFFGEDILVNMSVWADVESLRHFVFKTAHTEILSRRQEWFERSDQAYTVLWWIAAATEPTLEDAAERLACLQAEGLGPRAFTFLDHFPAADSELPE